jgi:hypothetical protein
MVRQKFPVVGVSLSAEKAHFEPITSIAAAERWASRTCTIAEQTTAEELHLCHLRQVSDITKLVLTVDPVRGPRGVVLNISHSLISHGSYFILEAFVSYLAHKECQFGIERIFAPEDVTTRVPKLPQSLSNAYIQKFGAPTTAQMDTVAMAMEKAAQRWSRSSIGIPTHRKHEGRKSVMHNKEVKFEDAEFREALQLAKREKLTLTALFFAAITAGIHQRYSNGTEDGAHLLFSGNARRWMDVDGRDGQQPVALSILPGALWLDKASLAPDADDKVHLLRLARDIYAVQDIDLTSEHVIGFYDQSAPAVAKATRNAASESLHVPPYCRPTMTSQGAFKTEKASGNRDHSLVRFLNFKTGGRNTEPSVCFALYSCNGELRCNLIFDEKYFDQDELMQLMYMITAHFRRMIGQSGSLVGSTKL